MVGVLFVVRKTCLEKITGRHDTSEHPREGRGGLCGGAGEEAAEKDTKEEVLAAEI